MNAAVVTGACEKTEGGVTAVTSTVLTLYACPKMRGNHSHIQ